jgi:septal ring factor EnvC (AmiA/AmiB activator)
MAKDVKRQAAREIKYIGNMLKGLLEFADTLTESADVEKELEELKAAVVAAKNDLANAEAATRKKLEAMGQDMAAKLEAEKRIVADIQATRDLVQGDLAKTNAALDKARGELAGVVAKQQQVEKTLADMRKKLADFAAV